MNKHGETKVKSDTEPAVPSMFSCFPHVHWKFYVTRNTRLPLAIFKKGNEERERERERERQRERERERERERGKGERDRERQRGRELERERECNLGKIMQYKTVFGGCHYFFHSP